MITELSIWTNTPRSGRATTNARAVVDERFEFAVDDNKFVALCRRARFVRAEETEYGRENYFYEIGESRAVFVSSYALFPLPPSTTIENYSRGHGLFRPFHPHQATRYGAKIFRDGTGSWFYRTQDKKGDLGFLSQSPFRLMAEPNLTEFLKLPQAEFLDLCAQQWNSPASELRASYEFDQLSLAERDAQVLACGNGDANEMRLLMNLLAHAIWSEAARLELQFSDDYENTVWFNWQSDESYRVGEDEGSRYLNRLYQSWRAAIFRVLEPRYIGQESLTHIQSWLGQARHPLSCVVESPTHHEQLEAQLQLREWAKQHLAEDERNELFALSK